ncbi:hypothetical protein PS15p_208474 [Mucor circinelloides]
MKKQFSAIASKINASTPMKWGDVPESDQDYYCLILEHLAQLAWKSTRQKMKKKSEKKNKSTMGNNMTDNQQEEQAPEEQSHHLETALSPTTLSGTGSNDILFGNIDQETNNDTQASYSSPPPSMSTSNKKALKRRRRVIVPDEEEEEEDDNDEQRYSAYYEALREPQERLQQALEGEQFDDYEMAIHEMNEQENRSSRAKKSLCSKTKKQRAPAAGRKSTQKKKKSNRIAALKN